MVLRSGKDCQCGHMFCVTATNFIFMICAHGPNFPFLNTCRLSQKHGKFESMYTNPVEEILSLFHELQLDDDAAYIAIRGMQKGLWGWGTWPLTLTMDERWLKNVMSFNEPAAALWHSTVGTNCGSVHALFLCVYISVSPRTCGHVHPVLPCLSYSSSHLNLWCGMRPEEIPFWRQNKQRMCN